MLLNFHFLVALVHLFCSNTKTFKVSIKVNADATCVPMGRNENAQKPGEK